MIPVAFDYARAKSVNAVLKALAAGDGTKIISGGQSLIPLLRFRLAQPTRVLDISRLDKLKGIKKARGGVRVGGATTYREILESELIRERYPMIAQATEGIGDIQVRNCGTLGGSLAHADPASDMPAVMLALDASLTLKSKAGDRTVPARQFFKGPFETAMREDELLTDILLPTIPRSTGSAYVCFEQAASGYALVGVAAVLARSRRTITGAALAFTGLTDTPFLAGGLEPLVGTKGESESFRQAAERALSGVEASGDLHAPGDYRLHLAHVAARRALTQAYDSGK